MAEVRDFIIIGAGIVGLSLAAELKRRLPESSILILEKEKRLGCHASGRNSGVLHAGIYYPKETLKARICREGAQLMATYCQERGLPFVKTGKIILPTRASDGYQLDMLYQRAISNGAPVEYLDEPTLRRMEPEAYSATGCALWSPETASFDPKSILECLAGELQADGVKIQFGAFVRDVDIVRGVIEAGSESFAFGHLFNTAGLQADRIANVCGVGRQYAVLPFKGLYYELADMSALAVHHHVYPVPDLNMPFLGVHFTKSVSGKTYIGPTAIPAFGRENYAGLQQIDWLELPGLIGRLMSLYCNDVQHFRRYSQQEALRFFKPLFVKAAQALLPNIRKHHLKPSSKVGIRPQLYDRKSGMLVMDFLLEEGEKSTHILNAISPAFTCAFAFARFVLDNGILKCSRQEVEYPASYATQR